MFRNAGLIADGNLIYALNKIDEEKLSIEFMLCAKESRHKGVKKLTYRSYLMISHMTSVVVKNDYETNMEGAYLQLMKVARNNGMKIISPFITKLFHEGKSVLHCEGCGGEAEGENRLRLGSKCIKFILNSI